MQKRKLGDSGLEIAPLVFGGNVFGWTVDESTSFSLLDAFVAAGFDCIDTADVYSKFVPGNEGGESETIIGRWLRARGKREDVVLATKVGMSMGGDRKGLSKRYIAQAVEDSLTRLQTDYIDLYQAHKDDPNTPLEETLAAFDGLIKAGKVRAIGASNSTGARLGEGLRISARAPDGTVEAIEDPSRRFLIGVQWHAETLVHREAEAELFRRFVDACRDDGAEYERVAKREVA